MILWLFGVVCGCLLSWVLAYDHHRRCFAHRQPASVRWHHSTPLPEGVTDMPSSLTLTNKQHCPAGVSILDADGQPFAVLPPNVTVAFNSENNEIADVVPDADGMNCDITSGKVGVTSITASVTMPDGTVLSDSIAVAVVNSEPGSVNFTAGTPVAEA